MAFQIFSTDDNNVPGIEYLPAGAITPKVGMALTQKDGKLAVATGAAAPTYLSMCQKENACEAGEVIPVIRVGKQMILETTFSVTATAVKLGDKVTLGADGLQVTAATADGVAEVIYMDGTEAGSKCRVRF